MDVFVELIMHSWQKKEKNCIVASFVLLIHAKNVKYQETHSLLRAACPSLVLVLFFAHCVIALKCRQRRRRRRRWWWWWSNIVKRGGEKKPREARTIQQEKSATASEREKKRNGICERALRRRTWVTLRIRDRHANCIDSAHVKYVTPSNFWF